MTAWIARLALLAAYAAVVIVAGCGNDDRASKGKDANDSEVAARGTKPQPRDEATEPAGPFGAIAVAQDGVHAGLSYDKASAALAEEAAVQTCERSGKGGKALGCKSQLWFKNGCGALAMGDDGAFGTGWGDDPRTACRWALKTCRDHRGRNCEPNYYACSPRKQRGTCDGGITSHQ